MRLGLVCPYDIGEPGGVQQLTGELAGRLRDEGIEVVFIGAGNAWFGAESGLDEITVPAGKTTSVRANDSSSPVTLSPLSWSKVRRALDSVDVVHVHEPLVPLVGWAAMSTSKPLVATFHADPRPWVGSLYHVVPGVGRRLRRAALTAVSGTAARAIPDRWGDVRIIPNAIDVASYDLSAGREERKVAFLGRDDPRKGLSTLLEAWPAIVSAVPRAELVVMGATREAGPPGVRFVGRVSGAEKKRLLVSSQVFVAPNLGGESFGIVVLEGMSAGCAVVASNLPAFAEVTDDTALLVPAGDTDRLASAVSSLLLDPVRARGLGDRAKVRAARFDWSHVLGSYLDLYEEATS